MLYYFGDPIVREKYPHRSKKRKKKKHADIPFFLRALSLYSIFILSIMLPSFLVMVSLFNGISAFCGIFNVRAILVEEKQ